ncbi:hypothetical protein PI124_g18182 [Phytophthora idaei]|nr:hypothetical protein PI124_g18182 [Phytophthora idaei]
MRRETYMSEDANERVSQLLRDFSEGPGNAANVLREKRTGMTSCITFQMAFMRRMTRKFPEAVCIDTTYGTNVNRYRLFSFMVTDKFGCGAFAQHALVDGESRSNMQCAVSAFKENNPAWKEVRVIIIGKDFTELALLKDEFPDADIILCHFHVIDYLKRGVSKKNYGFMNSEKTHVKNLITLMVRASSEESFDHYLSALTELCRTKTAL